MTIYQTLIVLIFCQYINRHLFLQHQRKVLGYLILLLKLCIHPEVLRRSNVTYIHSVHWSKIIVIFKSPLKVMRRNNKVNE